MTDTRDLKPCPFCGRSAFTDTTKVDGGWWCAEVACSGSIDGTCSVRMIAGARTKGEAVDRVRKSWNTRNDF